MYKNIYKNGEKFVTFEDIEIEMNKFYRHKTPIFWEMQILRKYQYLTRFHLVKRNYKYFIGYFYNGNKVKPFNIVLSKTNSCVKSYNRQTKLMYFFIEDDDLIKKSNTIWNKVSADIEKNLIASLSIINNF